VRVGVTAGNGSPGLSGTGGLDAVNVAPTVGMQGAPGSGSREFVSTCDDSTHSVGAAPGTNSCGAGANTSGGAGGDGGRLGTHCTCILGACVCTGSDCNATPGIGGAAAALVRGVFGLGRRNGSR